MTIQASLVAVLGIFSVFGASRPNDLGPRRSSSSTSHSRINVRMDKNNTGASIAPGPFGLSSKTDGLRCPRFVLTEDQVVTFSADDARLGMTTFCQDPSRWPTYIVPKIYVGDGFTSSNQFKATGVTLNMPMTNSSADMLSLSISYTPNKDSKCDPRIPVVAGVDPGDVVSQCMNGFQQILTRCDGVRSQNLTAGGVTNDGCRVWSILGKSERPGSAPLPSPPNPGFFRCKSSAQAGKGVGPPDGKWCQCQYTNVGPSALFKLPKDGDCSHADPKQLLDD